MTPENIPTRLVMRLPHEAVIKQKVIAAYGGMCACSGCDEHRPQEMTLDHIHGGGTAQRQSMKRQGSSFWREVYQQMKMGQMPEDLQLLCKRCNNSKGTGEACRLDHAMDRNGQKSQGFPESMMADGRLEEMDSNSRSDGPITEEKLVIINARVRESYRVYLHNRECANMGEAVMQVIDETRHYQHEVLAMIPALMQQLSQIIQIQSTMQNTLEDLVLQHALDDPPSAATADEVTPLPATSPLPVYESFHRHSRRRWWPFGKGR